MPVVWKKKAGMKYIYQPFYTQQLGVHSREYVDPELIQEMLRILYKKFRFAGMNFNAKNLVGEGGHFLVDDKSNYVMKLDWEYERQHKVFSTNTKRNSCNVLCAKFTSNPQQRVLGKTRITPSYTTISRTICCFYYSTTIPSV